MAADGTTPMALVTPEPGDDAAEPVDLKSLHAELGGLISELHTATQAIDWEEDGHVVASLARTIRRLEDLSDDLDRIASKERAA